MASDKKPPDGINKLHEQDGSKTNAPDYAVVAEKTAAAIATQEQPPSATGNGSSTLNSIVPSGQQQPAPKPRLTRPKNRSLNMFLMFFPSSGRMGFETVKMSDEFPPIETIREMIAYETRLRLSEPIQELIDMYHTNGVAVTFIYDLIQQHVVEFFGYHDVNALRTALHRFPEEPAVKAAFYVKHNKVTQGLVNEGQSVRDVHLYNIEGQPTTLFSQMPAGQPLVLLAGSIS